MREFHEEAAPHFRQFERGCCEHGLLTHGYVAVGSFVVHLPGWQRRAADMKLTDDPGSPHRLVSGRHDRRWLGAGGDPLGE